MKLALAILCSFLLAGTPPLLAQPPATGAARTHACCHCGGKMPCCQSKPVLPSPPAPAAPAPAGNQNQLAFATFAVLIWTLPATPAHSISSAATPFSTAADAPLFAWNCVRLI